MALDPAQRLGNGPDGLSKLKQHLFFSHQGQKGRDLQPISWADLAAGNLDPPHAKGAHSCLLKSVELGFDEELAAAKMSNEATAKVVSHETVRLIGWLIEMLSG